ncbi:hypothetical protein AAE478_003394 [Parahypoxylon ruwenzoriense]
MTRLSLVDWFLGKPTSRQGVRLRWLSVTGLVPFPAPFRESFPQVISDMIVDKSKHRYLVEYIGLGPEYTRWLSQGQIGDDFDNLLAEYDMTMIFKTRINC